MEAWDEIVQPARGPFMIVKRRGCVFLVTATDILLDMNAFLTAAISGIEELRANVMLFWNKCAENKNRDNFMRGRALASVS